MVSELPAAPPLDARPAAGLALSVILPASSDPSTLRECLQTLASQSEPGWVLGEHWELLVVEESASEQIREAVRAFAGVELVPAGPAEKGETARAAAAQAGADRARGEWLLFTDAAALHGEASGSRALVEADRNGARLLSWGPRRRSQGLLGRAIQPLAESEIATAYAPAQVNDPGKRVGYASEAFLLIEAAAFRKLGGYARVASSLTPEADLAFAAKREKLPLRYRYAPEMLSSRAEIESWRFALLVNNALALAAWRVLDFLLLWGLLLLALLYPVPFWWERVVLWLLWLRNLWRIYRRAGRSGAPAGELALALTLGLPAFAVWAYAGWYRARVLRRVSWQGRDYKVPARR